MVITGKVFGSVFLTGLVGKLKLLFRGETGGGCGSGWEGITGGSAAPGWSGPGAVGAVGGGG